MRTVTDVHELSAWVSAERARQRRIVFVPTMGNLHAGHLALVRRARTLGDRVIVSVFVNPTQFAPGEDYATYPRTPQADAERLAAERVEVLFTPDVDSIYPDGARPVADDAVPAVGRGLEEAFRPGFFAGVVAVVQRLFELVAPDVAVFGEKDYQQLAVVRAMVVARHLPVDIVGVPTVREADGLALSSRNQYLSTEERARAPLLYHTLAGVVECLRAGSVAYRELEQDAMDTLAQGGFVPDYVCVRQADTLQPVVAGERRCVVLAAARLGKARLIDNCILA